MVSDKIKALLNMKGKKYKELAKLFGISEQAIPMPFLHKYYSIRNRIICPLFQYPVAKFYRYLRLTRLAIIHIFFLYARYLCFENAYPFIFVTAAAVLKADIIFPGIICCIRSLRRIDCSPYHMTFVMRPV